MAGVTDRLYFIFRRRYVCVKPAMPNAGADLFGWLTVEENVVEAFSDDRRRYGWYVALHNFVGTVFWRWRRYDEKRKLGEI